MITILKYKLILVIIIFVFIAFNSGLPVVLHYCKMVHSFSSEKCSMCHNEMPQHDQEEYSKTLEECCINYIIIQANKHEFIHNQFKGDLQNLNPLNLLVQDSYNTQANDSKEIINLNIVLFTHFENNILIFNSALLI